MGESVEVVQWETAVLPLLAGYIGVALSYQQLAQQAWQRANQLETIYHVTESVRVLKPLQQTLQEIHDQLLQDGGDMQVVPVKTLAADFAQDRFQFADDLRRNR